MQGKTFKAEDRVKLVSGGPPMTVERVGDRYGDPKLDSIRNDGPECLEPAT
jgi:hypothetical protein